MPMRVLHIFDHCRNPAYQTRLTSFLLMDCPPSSPPRLLPGFTSSAETSLKSLADSKRFSIYQDQLATPLPTSERDEQQPSSPPDAVRKPLCAIQTLKLIPDRPVYIGRSSRTCQVVLDSANKQVSRTHARLTYESSTDLIVVECLGWNGLRVVVPTQTGSKEYNVIRNQTIYIERVVQIEVLICDIRTFVAVSAGLGDTTEDEATDAERENVEKSVKPRKKVRAQVASETAMPSKGSSNDDQKRKIYDTPKNLEQSSPKKPKYATTTPQNRMAMGTLTPKKGKSPSLLEQATKFLDTPKKLCLHALEQPESSHCIELTNKLKRKREAAMQSMTARVSDIEASPPVCQNNTLEEKFQIKENITPKEKEVTTSDVNVKLSHEKPAAPAIANNFETPERRKEPSRVTKSSIDSAEKITRSDKSVNHGSNQYPVSKLLQDLRLGRNPTPKDSPKHVESPIKVPKSEVPQTKHSLPVKKVTLQEKLAQAKLRKADELGSSVPQKTVNTVTTNPLTIERSITPPTKECKGSTERNIHETEKSESSNDSLSHSEITLQDGTNKVTTQLVEFSAAEPQKADLSESVAVDRVKALESPSNTTTVSPPKKLSHCDENLPVTSTPESSLEKSVEASEPHVPKSSVHAPQDQGALTETPTPKETVLVSLHVRGPEATDSVTESGRAPSVPDAIKAAGSDHNLSSPGGKPRKAKPTPKEENTTQKVSVTPSTAEAGANTTITEEMRNAAINQVAFSRLNSTPLTQLMESSSLLSSVPAYIISQMLDGIKCIGVIHRTGKDALGKPLESEYYYRPEFDLDPERLALFKESKGGRGLRSCRRVHKQYFYKKPSLPK